VVAGREPEHISVVARGPTVLIFPACRDREAGKLQGTVDSAGGVRGASPLLLFYFASPA
jgi:hypothetical protein